MYIHMYRYIIINLSLIKGLELLSWGGCHSCDSQFRCPGQLSQSLHHIKRVMQSQSFLDQMPFLNIDYNEYQEGQGYIPLSAVLPMSGRHCLPD